MKQQTKKQSIITSIKTKKMKGLDNYITGANDPSAPFNQLDIDDQYPYILEKCEWLTDEMYENDYEDLSNALDAVMSEHAPSELNYDKTHLKNWQFENAEFLATQLLYKLEEIQSSPKTENKI